MHTIRILGTAMLGAFAIFISSPSAPALAQSPPTYKYRVTVQNVTAGNVLSPFLSVVLKRGASLFELARPASAGIAAVAETGGTAVLEEEIAYNPSVFATVKAAGGPISTTEARSLELEVPVSAVQNGVTLNVVAMIGRSNDSFIAIRDLSLASAPNWVVRVPAVNFDAGSEENTGNAEDFGPSGHPTAAAEGHITFDRGLNLRGNAPETYAWSSVAALVTVERLN